jgi:hypothetical protein
MEKPPNIDADLLDTKGKRLALINAAKFELVPATEVTIFVGLQYKIYVQWLIRACEIADQQLEAAAFPTCPLHDHPLQKRIQCPECQADIRDALDDLR